MAVNLGRSKAAIKHRLELIPHLQLESYFVNLFNDRRMGGNNINNFYFLVLWQFQK